MKCDCYSEIIDLICQLHNLKKENIAVRSYGVWFSFLQHGHGNMTNVKKEIVFCPLCGKKVLR